MLYAQHHLSLYCFPTHILVPDDLVKQVMKAMNRNYSSCVSRGIFLLWFITGDPGPVPSQKCYKVYGRIAQIESHTLPIQEAWKCINWIQCILENGLTQRWDTIFRWKTGLIQCNFFILIFLCSVAQNIRNARS